MARSVRFLLACPAAAVALFAGQSLLLDGRQVLNPFFPNIGHSASVRLEFYIHDWQTQPTSDFIVSDAIGIQANLYSIPQPSGPPQMELAVFSTWSTFGTPPQYPGILTSLDALFPTTKAAYVRIQRDAGARLLDIEIWDLNGNRVYAQQIPLGNDVKDDAGGISVSSAGPCDLAFFRIHSALVPMNSRPPVTVDNEARLLEWKFDYDLSDSSGNGYPAYLSSGEAIFVTTPYQNVVTAFPKTYNAPIWTNWVSMRAGFPNQLDGTASYSQSDTSAAVTYYWTQAQSGGPTTLTWDDPTLGQPTVTGTVFGTYDFTLTVTDVRGYQATASLDVGAVAMDDNGVVINSDPVVDQIFGPMIAYGKNPWGYADYLAMRATTLRYADYLGYGLSATWPYASWETTEPGTVSYTWNGKSLSYAGAAGTTITSAIDASGIASFTVDDPTLIDTSELPTRVYLKSSGLSWEEIRICGALGNTLTPCYDGRGWADPYTSRLAAQAWPAGTPIGQFKVTGTKTAFLTTLCQSGAQGQVGLVSYAAGTMTMTPGSTAVAGTETAWASTMAGDYLRVAATHGGQSFVFVALIASVANGTHLTLSRPWPVDADSGPFPYAVVAQSRWPVLHYTRADASDAMQYWPPFGCESDTSLYLQPYWDIPAYDAQTYTATSYSYMDGNWWLSFGSDGGLNFYGEDLAHRALYYRSGYSLALTAANMIGDMWVRMPEIGGHLVYAPLYSGGLVIGGIADALLSTTPHKASWSDLRSFAGNGVSVIGTACPDAGDSRDTGYQLAWLALAALYDPDTTSTAAPGGIPWQTYWRNQLPAMYTRELGCKGSDNSWASGFYWNPYGDQIALIGGSTTGTGTNISTGTCFGAAAGSGTATNGSGVIIGSGFVAGTRIAITGTRGGSPFTMWQYYTLNSPAQITLVQGAAWQGDSGAVTWMIDNTSNFLTFMQSNDDPMGAENWSCIRKSSSEITLNRPWDGPSGTYYGYSSNVVGVAQQPYMLGIRQSAWRWAAMAAAAMGNSRLAASFNSLRAAAGQWTKSAGFDSLVTKGMYYSRVQQGCEPITPASMGFEGDGPCFDDDPSNSQYDTVAMRELTGETNASLWSYFDTGAPDRLTWGDLAYGSLWGWAPYTARKFYTPADLLTEQNPQYAAGYGLQGGKWTGFFFGMGMAHQWPAIRLGQPHGATFVPAAVPFSLPPGAAQVQVTLTAPSGAKGAPFVCTAACSSNVDTHQGAWWAHLVYQDSTGGTVSTTDELLSPATPPR